MPVIDSSDLVLLLEEVQNNVDLSLGELLFRLQERVGLSGFQLAELAGIDPGAFNKIVNGREGRVLHGDQVEALVGQLVEMKLVGPGDYTDPSTEGGLWRMALQAAAAADAQIALFRKRAPAASQRDFLVARREAVAALRNIWKLTSGALPMAPPTQERILTVLPVEFCLTWGESPQDLDLHLSINSPDQSWLVFYGERGSLDEAPWAALDVDIRSGLGPEKIVLRRTLEADYHCFVHNCSGETPLTTSHAVLTVSSQQGQTVFNCPENGDGRVWWVFSVYRDSRGFVSVNAISDEMPEGLGPDARLLSLRRARQILR